MTNKVKINYYTKSEVVELTFGNDPTSYIYNTECVKLTKELLNIIEKKMEATVITKEFKD
tara:strand:+ start:144 stop:323 length:180 start_codon:yes stop_codon:yes gene_type:complete